MSKNTRASMVAMVLSLGGCWPLIPAAERDRDLYGAAPQEPNAPEATTEPEPEPTEPTGPSEPSEPMDLRTLEPDFGSNGGAREVTLQGHFGRDPEVLFGGVPAAVLEASEDTLTVVAPFSDVIGWVDVTVVSGGDRVTLADGFQYFEDATGRAGLVGEVSYLEIVGDYWFGGRGAPSAWASLAFTEPSDWSYEQNYAADVGRCAYDQFLFGSYDALDPGSSSVTMVGPSRSFAIQADGTGAFFGVPEADRDVVPGTTYDLAAVNGDAEWPSFDVPAVVQVPARFRVTAPIIDQSYLTWQRRAIDVAWTGSGGDYMIIEVWRNDSSGYYRDRAACVVPDTGSYQFPPGIWPSWTPGDQLHLKVGRAIEGSGTVPTNDGENRVTGIYWVYGVTLAQ